MTTTQLLGQQLTSVSFVVRNYHRQGLKNHLTRCYLISIMAAIIQTTQQKVAYPGAVMTKALTQGGRQTYAGGHHGHERRRIRAAGSLQGGLSGERRPLSSLWKHPVGVRRVLLSSPTGRSNKKASIRPYDGFSPACGSALSPMSVCRDVRVATDSGMGRAKWLINPLTLLSEGRRQQPLRGSR